MEATVKQSEASQEPLLLLQVISLVTRSSCVQAQSHASHTLCRCAVPNKSCWSELDKRAATLHWLCFAKAKCSTVHPAYSSAFSKQNKSFRFTVSHGSNSKKEFGGSKTMPHECEKEQSPPRLLLRDEAPEYLQKSKPWVHSGFLVGGTPAQAARTTLLSWTNETLNAWTMFPGVLVALASLQHAARQPPLDSIPYLLFALSALPHAPFAIMLHCTIGVSERTRDIWRACDIFFIFTCGELRGLALAWFAFDTAKGYALFAAATATVYSHCLKGMHTRGLSLLTRPPFIRDCFFTVLCFVFPCALAAAKEVCTSGQPGPLTGVFLAVVLVDSIGATSYVFRVPERWFPGRFDFVGNGHQIMHFMVALEYYFQLKLLLLLASSKLKIE